MLDTNICIHVMRNYPLELRKKFNALAEQLCMSSITLGELHYGAEKSTRRAENLTEAEPFPSRVAVVIEPSRSGAVVDPVFLRRSCRQDGDYCVGSD
jgi:tRNA(fMet)-specific endonuclease VapC